jgi:glucose/mannose-6-phosphate isomerase
MGGSAIGGDILSVLLSYDTNIPISTVRNYVIPVTADSSTLVFACSYSGNTEETLSAVDEALDRRCKIIGITSGGKLEEFCMDNDLLVVKIPKGLPPRAAIAYLFFPMLVILERLKVILEPVVFSGVLKTLKEQRDNLLPEVPGDENRGKMLAQELTNGIPYIYGHTYLNIIAKRWQTQLNENAKVVAVSGGFPDMNHNELVGWAEDNPDTCKQFVIVLLRSADEHPRMTKRMELTKNTLETKVGKVIEASAEGENRLSRMMSTMYLGDYTSVYLAILRGIDPTPVEPIEELKKKMVE